MTRKSAVLFSLILLAIGPGCRALTSGTGPHAPDGPVMTRYESGTKAPIYSTALAGMESKPIGPQVKSEPDRTGPALVVQPIDTAFLPPLGATRNEPKKPVEGTSGSVTLLDQPFSIENKCGTSQVNQAALTLMEDKAPDFEPAVQAFHLILANKHQEAIKVLRTYDDSTQEFFLRMFPLLAQIARTSIDKMSAQERSTLYEQVKGVEIFLRERCELLITKMAYCKSIHGFADYVPLPADHSFLAKTENRPGDLVQLYVELKNFASKQMKEGDYLTKLACSLELKDMHGHKVWSHTFDKNETTHRRSACLNDYHGNYSFYVPALPTGTYQLTLQVVDETVPEHRRVARKSIVFRVTPVANQLAPR